MDYTATQNKNYKRDVHGNWICPKTWKTGSFADKPLISDAGLWGELGIGVATHAQRDASGRKKVDQVAQTFPIGVGYDVWRSFADLFDGGRMFKLHTTGRLTLFKGPTGDGPDTLVAFQTHTSLLIGGSREWVGEYHKLLEYHSTTTTGVHTETTRSKSTFCRETSAYRSSWGVGPGIMYDTLTDHVAITGSYVKQHAIWREESTHKTEYWAGYFPNPFGIGVGYRSSGYSELLGSAGGFAAEFWFAGDDKANGKGGGALILSLFFGVGGTNLF